MLVQVSLLLLLLFQSGNQSTAIQDLPESEEIRKFVAASLKQVSDDYIALSRKLAETHIQSPRNATDREARAEIIRANRLVPKKRLELIEELKKIRNGNVEAKESWNLKRELELGFLGGLGLLRFKVSQVLPGNRLLVDEGGRGYILEGFDVANVVDGDSLQINDWGVVDRKETYTTIAGADRTVFVIQRFDRKPGIEWVRSHAEAYREMVVEAISQRDAPPEK